MLSEYRELFLEELEEQLQLMDEEILKLEQAGNSEQVIQSLFRAAHTLKGSSAVMGFEDMKNLTHEMEHLLDQVRSKKLEVTSPLIDLLFQSMDCLKQLKHDVVDNESSATDISVCLRELQSFSGKPAEIASGTVQVKGTLGISLDTRLKAQEAQDQGLQVFWIGMKIVSECVIKGARACVIHSKLCEWGEVLRSEPKLEEIDEQMDTPVEITFLFAGDKSSTVIKDLTSNLIEVVDVWVEPLDSIEAARISPTVSAQETVAVNDQHAAKSHTKSQTIRVSVERLEHLMNLVGELVIDRTRIHQVERTLSRRFTDDSVNELGQISDHLDRVIGDMQESVMKARMLPIEQLFNRFPRMVRDLSRDLGKEIDLIVEGKDTELDRTLIEEIADPLIHLIRNAVDHGIETPEIRETMGKPRKGALKIKAAHEDNQVVIYVEEDGAGIDPAKMKRLAVQKGVIDQEEADQLTEKEGIDLIFRPGFSTAAVLSDVSGRGVGMDIVKSHIEKLNGMIDIETELGLGTRFRIKLPLTLAIIDGLLVKLYNQIFIIPMSNIAEIVRVNDIQQVHGKSVILLRNQVIPVAWVHEHFRMPKPQKEKRHIPLVIVGSAEKRLALAVDELIGNDEIVIKSLGSYIGKVDGIAGATILGDGKVALILEVSKIINKFSGK
ncbi:chemotaxis protein CheA [Paenibacillus sp. sgz302251]|uniref:chemotaxis protein CheA n=1 Tax=Paenibacillus sp. sgz302251 TaxID=3414493 RepID=UPI003C7B1164